MTEAKEQKQEIQYDDFVKLDIRIGTILSAELVPETDKLIKCTVDVGDIDENGEKTTRTIVSGLAESINPEYLVGKQCPYVCNLAPRNIRGIVSEGMILAMRGNDGFVLLHPNAEIKPGTQIG